MAAAAAARAGVAKAKANEALNPSADKKLTDAQIMEEELEKKLNESRDFYLDEEKWNTPAAKKYIRFAQACGHFTRHDGIYESYFSNFVIGCVRREDLSERRDTTPSAALHQLSGCPVRAARRSRWPPIDRTMLVQRPHEVCWG